MKSVISGLVSYWTLDETSSNTAIDVSGNGHNALIISGVTQGVTGKIGKCFSFDPTGNQVKVPYHPDFNFSDFTMSTWYKIDNINYYTNDNVIFSQMGWFDGVLLDSFLPFSFEITYGYISIRYNKNGGSTESVGDSTQRTPVGEWHHTTISKTATMIKVYYDGVLVTTNTGTYDFVTDATTDLFIGSRGTDGSNLYFLGSLDEIGVWNRQFTDDEVGYLYNSGIGRRPFKNYSLVSTYPLVDYYTPNPAYKGSVLDTNGNIHFVPNFNNVGQKISPMGVVSTYSLAYTLDTGAYIGGALDGNGNVHFSPFLATVGQKINSGGTVSTYSLLESGGYAGAVVDQNGDVHFIANTTNKGQKVSKTGLVSTYTLVYTGDYLFSDGVLAPNGDIHFVPTAARGQKISSDGTVSTYSLVYTVSDASKGGVLSKDGSEIHFIPHSATVGQKINTNTGVVSTYSLIYTTTGAYAGGVLSQTGDIHFIPYNATVGQKIDKFGLVSTYSINYVEKGYYGGSLALNGDIHFTPACTTFGEKISEQLPLTSDIVFYAKLDELGGETPIDCVGGLVGTLSEPEHITQGVSGKIGTSYQFSGLTYDSYNNTYVDFGTETDLSELNTAGTVSVWIYPTTSTDTYRFFISKMCWSFDINGFGLMLSSDNTTVLGWLSDNNSSNEQYCYLGSIGSLNNWYHCVSTWDGNNMNGYINSVKDGNSPKVQTVVPNCDVHKLRLGKDYIAYPFFGKIDEVGIWNRALSQDEITKLYNNGNGLSYPFSSTNSKYFTGKNVDYGKLPSGDDSSINSNSFESFKTLLNRSIEGGSLIEDPIVSTYSTFYDDSIYIGCVLDTNGDIHNVPWNTSFGQKVNYLTGLVSTYSLVYTTANAYRGGVLDSNGYVHFVPYGARVGQKISPSGLVSTYSLVYTTTNASAGGVLAPNGDIHFLKYGGVGQKVSKTGVVSTYSMVGQTVGGVLAPDGSIHCIPYGSVSYGLRIDTSNDTYSTYSLVYTVADGYQGGVLDSEGSIHFVPTNAMIGQKVDINGIVSTYSILNSGYTGGILAPNGDICFIDGHYSNGIGQKIDVNGIVSTYSTGIDTWTIGGVMTPNGDIYYTFYGDVGIKISTLPAIPWSLGICCHPFFNKL